MKLTQTMVTLVAVAVSGCASMRSYSTPLTVTEGQQLVPALINAAERQGLRAYRGISGAVVDLEDGTTLSWQESADHRDFVLLVHLGGDGPEDKYEGRFAAARARADQIWAQAADARQKSVVSAVLMVPAAAPAPEPAPGFSMTMNGPGGSMRIAAPASAGPAGGGDCRVGSDGVRACGYDCRVGSDGRAACASTPDGTCRLNSNGSFSCGRDCRLTSSGFFVCG